MLAILCLVIFALYRHHRPLWFFTVYYIFIALAFLGRVIYGLQKSPQFEFYTYKKPYDFGAGGKGLDLLRIKTYGSRFGFDISVASQRCIYIPTDHDLCPGRVSACAQCRKPEDCFNSGGSIFCISSPIPASKEILNKKL